jgi:hypothetical protein
VDPGLLLVVVALTSVVAWTLFRGRLLPRRLGHALATALECIGLTVVFFGVNLLISFVAVLGLRMAHVFVPLYVADDVVLPLLSLAQGLVFRWWALGESS